MKLIIAAIGAAFTFAKRPLTMSSERKELTATTVTPSSIYTYGYYTSKYSSSGEWGYELDVYGDLGADYSFPLYDDDPYITQKFTTDVYLGTLN